MRDAAGHLTARAAFVPALSHRELARRVDEGMHVQRTDLTDDFTLTDLRTKCDGQEVLLFLHKDGHTQVVHDGLKLPEKDATLVYLAP
jgi:hypothetical protein